MTDDSEAVHTIANHAADDRIFSCSWCVVNRKPYTLRLRQPNNLYHCVLLTNKRSLLAFQPDR